MFDEGLVERAEALIAACRSAGIRIATAESCTGGLLAALLTEVPGSSAVLDRGFVTYSNEAKAEMLDVPPATLADHGAVSSATALAMALGALAHARADIALAITGIAGPGGATPSKPVGLVHFGLASLEAPPRATGRLFGDLGRPGVRGAALAEAVGLLESAVALAAQRRQTGP